MSATSSTRIGPRVTARNRRHRRCMFRHSRTVMLAIFAALLCWPLFGVGVVAVAAEVASNDASGMSLTLPVVVVILLFAMGATWTVGLEYFRMRSRIRRNERNTRKLAKELGVKLDEEIPQDTE